MCGSSSLLSITTVPSAACMWKCSGRTVEQPVPCELERFDCVCLQHCERTTVPSAVHVQSGSGRPVRWPVPCEFERINSVCLQHCDRTTVPSAVWMQSSSGRPVKQPVNLRGLTLWVCSNAIEPPYPQLCTCKAAVADKWNNQCPVNMMDWLWLLCVCSIAIEPLYPQLCACKAAVADQWNDQSPSPTELASRLLAVPCSLAFQREDNVSILQLIAEVLRPVFLSWGGGLGVLS